ncbi:hypothetical protein ACL2DZ_20065 [Sinorhizobium meliloti]
MQQTTMPRHWTTTPAQLRTGARLPIQQRATMEIVMAENPKNPPAKKTIEDPPEYVAVPGEATYQQNGQQAAAPSSSNIKGGLVASAKPLLGVTLLSKVRKTEPKPLPPRRAVIGWVVRKTEPKRLLPTMIVAVSPQPT